MQKFHKISIGAAQFGMLYSIGASSKVEINEIKKILTYANEMGINSIDTAAVYGLSEEILGKIGVKDWSITSKLSPVPETSQDIRLWVKNEVKRTLVNLKVDCLDTFLIHKPDQLNLSFGDEIYIGLEELKKDGLIKKHGVSLYNLGDIKQDQLFFKDCCYQKNIKCQKDFRNGLHSGIAIMNGLTKKISQHCRLVLIMFISKKI
jgi:aryl-alcohol dehydrogenase-like predicted oxidoreductase